jgi:hypothetical protein
MSILRSKEESWSYIHHAQYDISAIKDMVNSLNEEWDFDISRQKKYQTHRNTKCISLIKMDYEWIKGEKVNLVWDMNFLDEQTKETVNSIISDLENKIGGKAVRFEIIRMDPLSRIRSHKDRSDIGYLARRIHIPVITNIGAIFNVAGEQTHMLEGMAYEINNIKWHSVFNRSNEHRVHIIVDILPYEFYIGEVQK